MFAVKKAVKSVVDKEQQRILVISLAHDDELVIKGDHATVAKVEGDEQLKEALKLALKEMPEVDDFGRLSYMESKNFDFPKMFAKIGGKNWKGGEIPHTLSKYFSLLEFGLNATKTYGKAEDKPVWWPRRPKWKKSPSKTGMEECTLLIRLLLEHHGIDANRHYVNYPEEEGEVDSSSDSDEEPEDLEEDEENDDICDENDNDREDEEDLESGNLDLGSRVNRISSQSLEGNVNIQRRESNIRQMAEEFRQHTENEKKKRKNYVLLPKTTRSQSKRARDAQ